MEEVKFLISLNRLLHNLIKVLYQRQIRNLSLEVRMNSNFKVLQITLKTILHFITELNTGSTAHSFEER